MHLITIKTPCGSAITSTDDAIPRFHGVCYPLLSMYYSNNTMPWCRNPYHRDAKLLFFTAISLSAESQMTSHCKFSRTLKIGAKWQQGLYGKIHSYLLRPFLNRVYILLAPSMTWISWGSRGHKLWQTVIELDKTISI